MKIVKLEQTRLKKLSEIGERVGYFFRKPEYDAALLAWKNMGETEIASSLQQSLALLESVPPSGFAARCLETEFMKAAGAGDKGVLLWPLRAALTGKKASSGPFDILEILGKEESLLRLRSALEIVRKN